ncbi:MAG: hypothetical protein JWO86_4885, partial [Myxococcaceae bacterium]|nr:hypothetical protein [Myxococcaceae bacterium]
MMRRLDQCSFFLWLAASEQRNDN